MNPPELGGRGAWTPNMVPLSSVSPPESGGRGAQPINTDSPAASIVRQAAPDPPKRQAGTLLSYDQSDRSDKSDLSDRSDRSDPTYLFRQRRAFGYAARMAGAAERLRKRSSRRGSNRKAPPFSSSRAQ